METLLGRMSFLSPDRSAELTPFDDAEGGERGISKMGMLGFYFEVQFKPGVANRVADALSRKTGEQVVLGNMLMIARVDWRELEAEIAQERTIQRIHQAPTSAKKVLRDFIWSKTKYSTRVDESFPVTPSLFQCCCTNIMTP